jgi:hypothetical protein
MDVGDWLRTLPARYSFTYVKMASAAHSRSPFLRNKFRLRRDQGKVQQARVLAPIYGWLTEGFDTRDPKEAKALLDELAA